MPRKTYKSKRQKPRQAPTNRPVQNRSTRPPQARTQPKQRQQISYQPQQRQTRRTRQKQRKQISYQPRQRQPQGQPRPQVYYPPPGQPPQQPPTEPNMGSPLKRLRGDGRQPVDPGYRAPIDSGQQQPYSRQDFPGQGMTQPYGGHQPPTSWGGLEPYGGQPLPSITRGYNGEQPSPFDEFNIQPGNAPPMGKKPPPEPMYDAFGRQRPGQTAYIDPRTGHWIQALGPSQIGFSGGMPFDTVDPYVSYGGGGQDWRQRKIQYMNEQGWTPEQIQQEMQAAEARDQEKIQASGTTWRGNPFPGTQQPQGGGVSPQRQRQQPINPFMYRGRRSR